jgi:hypothetical protein
MEQNRIKEILHSYLNFRRLVIGETELVIDGIKYHYIYKNKVLKIGKI